ncbi:hypothetical protein [Agromyces laixinhei]|uniref:hypothetical protein n=1 Tax=Agromyces laixinhei TaxID=2585717 RepID=UPI001115BC13|nr:hypothetical protein [Agromyces laixinhei]
MTNGRAGAALERAMPEWTWNEFHSIAIPGKRTDVIDAADTLEWDEVPLFRRIMRATSLGRVARRGDERVLDLFIEGPYVEAHRDNEELLIIGVLQTRPGLPTLALDHDPMTGFRNAAPPRSVKIAMNFLYRDGILSTETRCQATDAFAARAFCLYWLAIRAGSGIIRGSWLRGIRRRAVASASV